MFICYNILISYILIQFPRGSINVVGSTFCVAVNCLKPHPRRFSPYALSLNKSHR